VTAHASSPETEAGTGDWRTAEEKAADIAQAKALREQAGNGGLRFEAYLPPGLASWVLDMVERGIFTDPSEAVFVILGEHKDLEPHADLRKELLKRIIQAAIDDTRPGISGEAWEKEWKSKLKRPLPAPAQWPRRVA
jgi:hypothetical protein